MKYRVQMSRIRREYLSFEIEAANEEDARKKARQYARDNGDDFCDSSVGSTRITKLVKPEPAT